MKFALIVLGVTSVSAADGRIEFQNRLILKADGTGTYSVPIWKPGGMNQPGGGAGTLDDGFTVGLFYNGVQLKRSDNGENVQSVLRTDANSQFFATGSQIAVVPNVEPGTRQVLEVRGWQGSGGFQAAVDNGLLYGSWTFLAKPLGDGWDGPSMVPGMTGWGPESGEGLELTFVPEASTFSLGLAGVAVTLLFRKKNSVARGGNCGRHTPSETVPK